CLSKFAPRIRVRSVEARRRGRAYPSPWGARSKPFKPQLTGRSNLTRLGGGIVTGASGGTTRVQSGGELQLVQATVKPAELEELGVGPPLADLPAVEHEDLIRVLNRRETVRDDERGTSAHELGERLVDSRFELAVDRARGFVQ